MIPDFQSIMLPLLQSFQNDKEKSNTELREDMVVHFKIKEDKLGLDKIYIQAKKWENNIGRPEIQKFVGALQGQRAKKGIFITTSTFSKEAFEYSTNLDVSVVLIDGKKLSEYMIENELGVTLKQNYKIHNIDSDYFIDE